MIKKEENNRLYWIDNLRAYVIILVILVHAGATYSDIGGWYYKEATFNSLDTLSTIFFGFFQMHTQAYFMGLLFLIAGYFSISSYNREGFSKYIKSRLFRLGIPTLIYVFIINPFILYFLLHVYGNTLLQFYHDYITKLYFVSGTGPLWFTTALLVFSIIYALYRKLKESTSTKNVIISKIKNNYIIIFSLITAIITYLVRIAFPFGTDVFNMQLCFFTQYIFFFIFGITIFKNNLFDTINNSQGKRWLIIGTIGSFFAWILVVIVSGALNGNAESLLGRGTWQSFLYSLWEMFTGASMSVGLIYLFKNRYDIKNKVTKILTTNSFAVYVIHPVILISLSLLFKDIVMYPILKFILIGLLSILTTYTIANLTIRRIPLLNKIFK